MVDVVLDVTSIGIVYIEVIASYLIILRNTYVDTMLCTYVIHKIIQKDKIVPVYYNLQQGILRHHNYEHRP